MTPDTIIIGAGLSGLSCASILQAAGKRVLVCEASERIGGRVATDEVDGFRLDRGFQVLLTAYPEAAKQLDYADLDLQPLYPGALVRYDHRWHRVADPFRHPVDGICNAFNPIGSLPDKLRVGKLRLKGFDFGAYPDSETSLNALQAEGFSETMIERFFRPFLSGVFLETHLGTSVRKMEDVLRNFARGSTVVPARGMGEIPAQLANRLSVESIRTGTSIVACDPKGVQLANGERLAGSAVVVATDVRAAQKLLGHEGPEAEVNSVACLYFEAPSPPPVGATLVLNGDGRGPINNLALMSAVSHAYAPEGRNLVSISVVDPEFTGANDLVERVSRQLREWFGSEATQWRHIQTYRIPQAVPARPLSPTIPTRLESGLYSCGDYSGIASLNTAMASGRLAAEAVLHDQV